ncbi:hypothetical protein SESBI_09635 [Sesbania bispinosa]|nr:hypothetical protein SESBI_09635 [Sesbania bispinosa]
MEAGGNDIGNVEVQCVAKDNVTGLSLSDGPIISQIGTHSAAFGTPPVDFANWVESVCVPSVEPISSRYTPCVGRVEPQLESLPAGTNVVCATPRDGPCVTPLRVGGVDTGVSVDGPNFGHLVERCYKESNGLHCGPLLMVGNGGDVDVSTVAQHEGAIPIRGGQQLDSGGFGPKSPEPLQPKNINIRTNSDHSIVRVMGQRVNEWIKRIYPEMKGRGERGLSSAQIEPSGGHCLCRDQSTTTASVAAEIQVWPPSLS